MIDDLCVSICIIKIDMATSLTQLRSMGQGFVINASTGCTRNQPVLEPIG